MDERARREDLGEGPETRDAGLPELRRRPHAGDGDHLIQPPGPQKPADQDAVGEGAVEELAEEPGAEAVEERERNTQEDNVRGMAQDPPAPNRRRRKETQAPRDEPPPQGLADLETGNL
ncbi:MAG TPA: hypothetical protein VEJ18_05690 [Planctomycetota bacterium]|nr:hypothetical protein [Planctomycetota bacterium]